MGENLFIAVGTLEAASESVVGRPCGFDIASAYTSRPQAT